MNCILPSYISYGSLFPSQSVSPGLIPHILISLVPGSNFCCCSNPVVPTTYASSLVSLISLSLFELVNDWFYLFLCSISFKRVFLMCVVGCLSLAWFCLSCFLLVWLLCHADFSLCFLVSFLFEQSNMSLLTFISWFPTKNNNNNIKTI